MVVRFKRPGKRTVWGSALTAAIVALACLSFGPIVRSQLAAESARRRIHLDVGSVRPTWFGIRLIHVGVRLEQVEDVRASLDEVRIALSGGFSVRRVDVRGGTFTATGPEDRLRGEISRWRGDRPKSAASSGTPTPIHLRGLSVRWDRNSGVGPAVEATNVDATNEGAALELTAGRAQVRIGRATIAMTKGRASIGLDGRVHALRAADVVVEWQEAEASPSTASEAESRSSQGPASPPVARVALAAPRILSSAAPAAPAAAPLIALPDTHDLARAANVMAAVLRDRLADGADVGAETLTWRVTPPREPAHDQVAFTIGPGPAALDRGPSGIDAHFSTDASAASTPLAVHALIPSGVADFAVTLEGGPVPLALLGVQEGAAGLVDVAHATVKGRARIVLAGDGAALTFDGEGGARGISLASPRLASEVVSGVDFQLRLRGALDSTGELRADDVEVGVGAIGVTAAGVLDQQADRVTGSMHFEVSPAPCQSLLESIPGALLPTLRGAQMTGQFAAHGRLAFDTRSLDSLTLDYDVRDRCRLAKVSPLLARERFTQPFTHYIYLPDGSLDQRTTGPGTPDWTPLDQISPYMQVAVLTTEDGAFRKHHGFNRASIRSSLIANLKARRFVRGASTITMQLAKNLFLSRDKTLSRKMEEVILTDYLEQAFSKDEIMELYLNVVEFGPDVYGITDAADYYFGRSPAELDLAESLFLSSLLPAPIRYGAVRDRGGQLSEARMSGLRRLMRIAHDNRRISDAELTEGEGEPVVFWNGEDHPAARPPARAALGVDGTSNDEVPDPFDVVPR